MTDERSADKSAAPAMQLEESAAKQLLFGNILEENLFPYPVIRERDRELLGPMTDAIDEFLTPKAAELRRFDRQAMQSPEFIAELRDMGLFGLIIPEEYGGLALSNAAYARVLQQTSRHDSSVSLTIGAHSSIGMKGLLLFGTDEQKQRYLPRLATGELIAAFCLTESGAGSDAAAIRTKAVRSEDGSWILNGEKIWITNGGIADFYTVFARTDTPEGKITAFLVEASWPGVSRGEHEDKMGIRASSTTNVAFSDVRVPAGERARRGRQGLQGGDEHPQQRPHRPGRRRRRRHEDPAAAGHRAGQGAPAVRPADRRVRPGAREDRADDGGLLRRREHGVDGRALIDSGCSDYSVEAAISKVFASEAVQRAGYEALQIAAGDGFMRELPYEQITRDTRILSIFEGTNEILRLYIALSGLKGVGANLGELKSAFDDIFNNPIKGFGVLSDYTGRRLRASTGIGTDRIHARAVPCPAQGGRDLREVRSRTVEGRRPAAAKARQEDRRPPACAEARSPTWSSTCSSACACCRAPTAWKSRRTRKRRRRWTSRRCSPSRRGGACRATSAR